jgi:hypothetical protein
MVEEIMICEEVKLNKDRSMLMKAIIPEYDESSHEKYRTLMECDDNILKIAIDCPMCCHDCIILGWTVKTSITWYENIRKILFIEPGEKKIVVYLKSPPDYDITIFFNMYFPS